MCIIEYFKDRAAGMGPGERQTIDRAWIEWLLDTHACDHTAPGAERIAAPASVKGYSALELAELFDRSDSTIRTWLGRGVFGDPAMLKPNGRDWHVPKVNVQVLQEKLSAGYWITADGLAEPSTGPAPSSGATAPRAHAPAGKTVDRAGPPPRRRRRPRKGGKHNEWREHVP